MAVDIQNLVFSLRMQALNSIYLFKVLGDPFVQLT